MIERTWPEPNAHGVYQPAETLALPVPTKGWKGLPIAAIDLLELPDGWRATTESSLRNGSGHCVPMTVRERAFPTREEAIRAGIARLRYRMEREHGPDARAVLTWLDTLLPAQGDLFDGAA